MNSNQEYHIIRGDRSGVFFGRITERKDREVTLTDCRRVWYWAGAASLSQLAAEGVKEPNSCRIAVPVEELTVLDAIELIRCTDAAVQNIKAVPEWRR